MLLYLMYLLAITTVVLHGTGTLANLDIEWAPFASAMGLLAVNCLDIVQSFLV